MRHLTQFILAIGLMLSTLTYASLPLEDAQGNPLPSLAPLLKKVNPAVVNIATQGRQRGDDPFSRQFFDFQRQRQNAGSGVIIDAKKGIVLTNFHVVDKAEKIEVKLINDKVFEAELLGDDEAIDIAVLKITADVDELQELPLANSDISQVGDFVLAIGNPFGVGQTVTSGIVSALNRDLVTSRNNDGYQNYIQTDAAINPGNSGGALVNLRGELIGINTMIISPGGGGGNVGIGFAIPINMAMSSVTQIIESGEVKRGALGVLIQDLKPDLIRAFKLDEDQKGVLVSQVFAGSAAEKAGVQNGDVILEINDEDMQNSSQLRNKIGLMRIGDKLNIVVLRDGRKKSLKAKVGEPAAPVAANRQSEPKGAEETLLGGVRFRDADDGQGVRVVEVERNSKAAGSLGRGDIVTEVNRKPIRNLDELKDALDDAGDDEILLRVRRGNFSTYVVLK